MRRAFFQILFVSVLLIRGISCHGAGLAIHPMEQFVKPSKAAIYYASNQSPNAIAVEVIPETWSISEEGEEIREVTRDLVVYPSQFILKGTTYKKVKVGLREGVDRLDREKCYRVTIRELPISLEKEEPGTYRIYRASAYRTSFYIQPKKLNPRISLVGAEQKDNTLTVRFRNEGNSHIHLRNPEITLYDSAGQGHRIEDLDFYKPISGENMHAGITRVFRFDLASLELPSTIVRGVMRFNDEDVLQGETYELRLQ